MSGVNNFYDLRVWQDAHKLVLEIYKITKDFPKEEKYGIIDQLRRASSSITANIAEGFGRYHFKEKTRFYYQARGSLVEVQNFLILSRDLDYLQKEEVEKMFLDCDSIIKQLNSLVKSTNKLLIENDQ